MGLEQWHEWDYIKLLMDVVWDLSGGKEKLRPSWKSCPCGDMLAILVRLRVLPRRWVDPERAAPWLRQRMASASPMRLSDELGYTREHLSRVKSGRRDRPTFETFIRIVLALGIGVPILASITQVRHEELELPAQAKDRRKQNAKRRGRPRQGKPSNFWTFRVSFWVTQIRDLRVLWDAEVTRNTAEVTHPNPLEVTLEAAEVTPGAAEVTVRPRGQVTRRALEVTPPEDDEGACTPTTFTIVECRRDDPRQSLARS